MAGLVRAGRRQGWVRSVVALRSVGVVLSLACFVGAGVAMLPTIVPAGLGWARSDWPRALRVGLVVVGIAAAVGVVAAMPDLGLVRSLVALALYLALCTVEVALVAQLYAPSLPRGALGRHATVLLVSIVLAVLLIVGLGLLMMGIRT